MTKPNFSNVSNISNEDDLKWKMASNGRLPKITKKKWISQQPLARSSPNFELRLIYILLKRVYSPKIDEQTDIEILANLDR